MIASGALKNDANTRARVTPPWSGDTPTFSNFFLLKYEASVGAAGKLSIGISKKP